LHLPGLGEEYSGILKVKGAGKREEGRGKSEEGRGEGKGGEAHYPVYAGSHAAARHETLTEYIQACMNEPSSSCSV